MFPSPPPAPCLPPACHCTLPPICAHLPALGNLTDSWGTIYQKHHPHLDTSTHIAFSSLSFTPYHAGHVVGACMFMIDIAGLKNLVYGDYLREEDRHLVKAEVPPLSRMSRSLRAHVQSLESWED